jgi:hypothetical protein
MTKDEALRLALEALEAHADIGIKSDKAITAIKAALEAKDEPLVYLPPTASLDNACYIPPQRKPLTDEEIQDALEAEFIGSGLKRNWQDDLRVARAIEAAHGIKGEV